MITFASLVPQSVIERSWDKVLNRIVPDPNDPPWSDLEHDVATMLIDISGYSKLTTALAKEGKVSTEVISEAVGGYFSQVIEGVVQSGGDIVKFLGDGLLVKWNGVRVSSCNPVDAANTIKAVVQCALRLLSEFGTFEVDTRMLNLFSSDKITLALHLGIGFGQVNSCDIGIPGTRLEYVVSGPAIEDLQAATDATKPGELGISPSAWKALSYFSDYINALADCTTVKTNDGVQVLSCAMAFVSKYIRTSPARTPILSNYNPDSEELQAVLATYINESAAHKIKQTQGNIEFNEHREITSVFIQLRGRFEVGVGQKIMEQTILITSKYKGVIQQFSVDDKGQTLLLFFGLPPSSSVNDSAEALKACTEIREVFRNQNLPYPAIGVATGQVFYTIVGHNAASGGRGFVTCLGDAVNVSARLMCLYSLQGKEGATLCDEATYAKVKSMRNYRLDDVGTQVLKGKPQPVQVYRLKSVSNKAAIVDFAVQNTLVGYEAQWAQCGQATRDWYEQKQRRTIVIEGAPGTGKSSLSEYVASKLLDQGVVVAGGQAPETEHQTSAFIFHIIIPFVVGLLASHDKTRQSTTSTGTSSANWVASAASLKEDSGAPVKGSPRFSLKVSSRFMDQSRSSLSYHHSSLVSVSTSNDSGEVDGANLQALDELRAAFTVAKVDWNLMPLLTTVLPWHLPENDYTLKLDARVRANLLKRTIVNLINCLSKFQPLVLIFDDAQWMDSTSNAIMQSLVSTCSDLLIIIVTRPIVEYNVHALAHLLNSPNTVHVTLDGLKTTDVVQMMKIYFECQAIENEEIAQSILKDAEARPLYIDLQLKNLKVADVFVVVDGVLRFNKKRGMRDLRSLHTDNMGAAILVTYDRAHPTFQNILKAAAAIGEHFTIELIHIVMGSVYTVGDIHKAILDHNQEGIIEENHDGSVRGLERVQFSFRHVMFIRTIYELIPYAQREAYHSRAAAHYDGLYGEVDNSTYTPIISYHYSRSANTEKHLTWLMRLTKYYYTNWQLVEVSETATLFLNELKEKEALLAKENTCFGPAHIADLHFKAAHAYVARSLFREGLKHAEIGLEIYKMPLPKSKLGLTTSILAGFVRERKRWKNARKDPPWRHETFHPDPLPEMATIIEGHLMRNLSNFHLNNIGPFLCGVLKTIHLPFLETYFPEKYTVLLATMALISNAGGDPKKSREYARTALKYIRCVDRNVDPIAHTVLAQLAQVQWSDPLREMLPAERVELLVKDGERICLGLYGDENAVAMVKLIVVENYFCTGRLENSLVAAKETAEAFAKSKAGGGQIVNAWSYQVTNCLFLDKPTSDLSSSIDQIKSWLSKNPQLATWQERVYFPMLDLIILAYHPTTLTTLTDCVKPDLAAIVSLWELTAREIESYAPLMFGVNSGIIQATIASFLHADNFTSAGHPSPLQKPLLGRWNKAVKRILSMLRKHLRKRWVIFDLMGPLLASLSLYICNEKSGALSLLVSTFHTLSSQPFKSQVAYMALLRSLVARLDRPLPEQTPSNWSRWSKRLVNHPRGMEFLDSFEGKSICKKIMRFEEALESPSQSR
ncbi:hypothetical protein BC832DRAFT_541997 [Gaertneriomyces semiglobifer]|nr:hypothetical protein BC832DRAFT_541997 [Gaertneriomyces semiglobifer]